MFTPAPNLLWELFWGTIFLASLIYLLCHISVMVEEKEGGGEFEDFWKITPGIAAVPAVVLLWSGYKLSKFFNF